MRNTRTLSRRDFLTKATLVGAGLGAINQGASRLLFGGAPSQTANSRDELYQSFQNPPKDYDLIPLWTWNGRIEPGEGKRQIDEMLGQGIRRAIVYPFPNMRNRFLSEEWWSLWGELLQYCRTKEFQLGVNAENEWPDGDAFDQYLNPPDQSHVLLGHPEYHMKRLAYVERDATGPGPVRFSNLPSPLVAVAARINGHNSIDGESLLDLSHDLSLSTFSSHLPRGDWRLMFFYLENTIGNADQMRVDPLNRAAMARFIDLTLGEYHRHFKEYFGHTFTFVLIDNEGDYGDRIAWTSALFETFQSEKGYDLKRYLPLLVYDGGKKTPKVRIDFLRVISDLYERHYWGQIAEWCKEHGLLMTAQGWSESLQYDAVYGGDYMQMMRSLGMPGVEALGYKGRSPREFAEDQTIADFEHNRYWCEGPLVLGSATYLSPQMERYTTNMLGLWGIDLLSPQFYYDVPAMSFPPDDFISQPWWKYFRHYTDYVRRITFMNGKSKHVADLLLYRPVDTTFAYADPGFKETELGRIVPESTAIPPSSTSLANDSAARGGWGVDYPRMLWNTNYAATVETAYFDLMELLADNQRSFNVADDHYLKLMKVAGGTLQIAGSTFRAIILPPMKVMNRESLKKIREFYEQGGLVVSFGHLPEGSSEEGWGDPSIEADIVAIFGIKPGSTENSVNQNARGGRAYFLQGNVTNVLNKIDGHVAPDLRVEEGSRERLMFLHKVKDDRDFYWVVNDTEHPREVVVSVSATGKPRLWDPGSGEQRDVPYWMNSGRTFLRLRFGVWDATYVVFDKSDRRAPEISIVNTNLDQYTVLASAEGEWRVEGRAVASVDQVFVEGLRNAKSFRMANANEKRLQPQVLAADNWKFQPMTDTVEVKYAREMMVPKGTGTAAGFEEAGYNDFTWPLVQLSSERDTLRDWWVLGPFADPNHGEGYNRPYAPEQKINLDGKYVDPNGAEIAWRQHTAPEPVVNVTEALALDPKGGSVAYATTWVYSAEDQQTQSILVTPNTKLWINGELIVARYSRANYFEWRDPFGYKRPVRLRKGWNQILVKLASDPRHPALMFYLHFLDANGKPAPGLISCWRQDEQELQRRMNNLHSEAESAERWYRLPVPPGTRSLVLPKDVPAESVFLNGREVKVLSKRVEYPDLSFDSPAVLAFKVPGDMQVEEPLRFESAVTNYHLGCWTGTGLTYYTGSASYEKDFELASELQGETVVLDCGSVGVVAEVWINGEKAGERLWEPFCVDITRFLRPGSNRLRIVVTNSSDALRTKPERMQVLDMNGLHGPVRLIPYRKAQFTLSQA